MRLLDFAAVVPREVAPSYLGRYLHFDHGGFQCELRVSFAALP